MRRAWRVTLALAALLLVFMREGLDLTDKGVRWLRLRHEASHPTTPLDTLALRQQLPQQPDRRMK
jgi:hypothetical protein